MAGRDGAVAAASMPPMAQAGLSMTIVDETSSETARLELPAVAGLEPPPRSASTDRWREESTARGLPAAAANRQALEHGHDSARLGHDLRRASRRHGCRGADPRAAQGVRRGRRRRRHRPRHRPRRDLRPARPERRRQVDDRRDPRGLPPAHGGRGQRARHRPRARRPRLEGPARHRAAVGGRVGRLHGARAAAPTSRGSTPTRATSTR